MAEWLERTVAAREVSGFESRPRWTKTFANVGNLLTTSVSAGLSKDWFHTLNTHNTKPRTTQQHFLHIGTGSRSVPTRCCLLISSRMTNGGICCMSEKKVLPTSYTDPLYDMIFRYRPLCRKWRLYHNKIKINFQCKYGQSG